MIEFLIYLLKVSLAMTVFFLIYRVIFRRYTFFYLNRVYLLVTLLASFLLPFLQLDVPTPSSSMSSTLYEIGETVHYYEVSVIESAESNQEANGIPWLDLLAMVYWVGLGFFLIRFYHSLRKLGRLRKRAERSSDYLLINSSPSFTFMRSIFISRKEISSPNLPVILSHERIHRDELHSIDLLLLEVVNCILWFNPVLFLIRNSVRENHEYIADAATLSQHPDKINYLKILYNSVAESPLKVTNAFNFSNINNRINMITKVKTKRMKGLLYMLLIPTGFFISFAFSPAVKEVAIVQTVSPAPVVEIVTDDFEWPISKSEIDKVSSGFGMRMHPQLKKRMHHTGIDLIAPTGTNVLASAGGKIIVAKEGPKKGKYIVIDHGDDKTTMYSHLSVIDVAEGEEVKQGEKIAEVGSTGYSTGPHLHFEIRESGKAVDPEKLLK